jgi:hypothetical protein
MWPKIANAVGYQIVWFACVYGASLNNPWLGFGASLIFCALTLRLAGNTKNDFRILCIALCVGMCVDTFFAASGLIAYKASWPLVNVAPLWIIALWLSFSLTLNHSMAFLRRNLWVACVFGLLGGPLAYFGADRLFNVLTYNTDTLWVLLSLGLAWAIAIPAIFALDERLASAQKSVAQNSL